MKGGQFTFIRLFLSGFGTYFVSFFLGFQCLKKIMRDSLWKGIDEGKWDYSFKWEVDRKPINFGGLEIGNVRARNKSIWLNDFRGYHEFSILGHKDVVKKFMLSPFEET